MIDHPLLGSWRLISWENRTEGGEVSYPMGEGTVGFLHYSSDERMSVAVMAAGRPNFAADDLLSGTVAEKAAAMASFTAYCGRFEVFGDRVVHHVEVSSFPNWVGTRQERFMAFDGDRLTLSTAPLLLRGKTQRAYLTWERVGGEA